MRQKLENLLKGYESFKEDESLRSLYRSVQVILENNDPAPKNDFLQHSIHRLIDLYELVSRNYLSGPNFAPKSITNRFMCALASIVAEETKESQNDVLYALSLHRDNKEWINYCSGEITFEKTLPTNQADFAVTPNGDICLLEPFIVTGCQKILEGHRKEADIWQHNDYRSQNTPLSQPFLQKIAQISPTFKKLRHEIKLNSNKTPLEMLQMLREGLRQGSKEGTGEGKGTEYEAGAAADNPLSDFSIWWEDTKKIILKDNTTLYETLSNLPTAKEKSLGQLLDIALRDTSANVHEDMGDATTCIQIIGNDIENAINLNNDFLKQFENQSQTKEKLDQDQINILKEIRENQSATTIQPISPIFENEPPQLPYFNEAFALLWQQCWTDHANEDTLVEFDHLIKALSSQQKQRLWHKTENFDLKEMPWVRARFRALEEKLKKNCLLNPNQQSPLTPMETALLKMIPSNRDLLAFITNRYEFIIFTQPELAKLVKQEQIEVTNRFKIHDDYNLAYYMYRQTSDKNLENKFGLRKAIFSLNGLGSLNPPKQLRPILHQAILQKKTRDIERLVKDRSALFQVDWETGNSALMLAAQLGNANLVETLIFKGLDITFKNIKGQTAEDLWRGSQEKNPCKLFRLELAELPKLNGSLTPERRKKLMALLENNPRFLPDLFMQAASNGNTALCERLIDLNVRPDMRAQDGKTALHLAAKGGHVKTCELLIQKGCNVNAQDQGGSTPLGLAAGSGSQSTCELLIKHHADVNIQNRRGGTALVPAATTGHLNICELLIQNKAAVDAKENDGGTALMWAAYKGHSTVCDFLIKHGADLTIQDNKGYTALMWAAAKGHSTVCDVLIEHGADVNILNNEGKTALMWAAEKGHDKVCDVLMLHDIDTIKATNNHGKTVEALWRGNSKKNPLNTLNADLLELANAKNSLPNDRKNYLMAFLTKYPMFQPNLFVRAAARGNKALCEHLIKHDVHFDGNSPTGQMALRLAAVGGHYGLCELLIQKGVDVNAQNQYGRTALIEAASEGHLKICQLLIQNNASVNIKKTNGATALTCAAYCGHQEICELLINHHADVNVQDEKGLTALMYAADGGHLDVCKLLISHKALVNLQTSSLRPTALMLAAGKGHSDISTLLIEHQADVNLVNSDGKVAADLWKGQRRKNPFRLLQIELKKLAKPKNTLTPERKKYLMDLLEKNPTMKPDLLVKAVFYRNDTLFKHLIQHKDLLDIKNKKGQTALMIASKNGDTAKCELLLKKGALVDLKSSKGKTADQLWPHGRFKNNPFTAYCYKKQFEEAKNEILKRINGIKSQLRVGPNGKGLLQALSETLSNIKPSDTPQAPAEVFYNELLRWKNDNENKIQTLSTEKNPYFFSPGKNVSTVINQVTHAIGKTLDLSKDEIKQLSGIQAKAVQNETTAHRTNP